jgi:hypothetical protein
MNNNSGDEHLVHMASAGRPMPDGARAEAGGWSRIHFIVDDLPGEVARLRAAGAQFRNDIVIGPGGSQILLRDPSGTWWSCFSRFGTHSATLPNRCGLSIRPENPSSM